MMREEEERKAPRLPGKHMEGLNQKTPGKETDGLKAKKTVPAKKKEEVSLKKVDRSQEGRGVHGGGGGPAGGGGRFRKVVSDGPNKRGTDRVERIANQEGGCKEEGKDKAGTFRGVEEIREGGGMNGNKESKVMVKRKEKGDDSDEERKEAAIAKKDEMAGKVKQKADGTMMKTTRRGEEEKSPAAKKKTAPPPTPSGSYSATVKKTKKAATPSSGTGNHLRAEANDELVELPAVAAGASIKSSKSLGEAAREPPCVGTTTSTTTTVMAAKSTPKKGVVVEEGDGVVPGKGAKAATPATVLQKKKKTEASECLVKSLTEMCLMTVIDNLDMISDVGGLDAELLQKILVHCNWEQLKRIEDSTEGRDLTKITDGLWKDWFRRRWGQESVEVIAKKQRAQGTTYKWKDIFEAKVKEQEEVQTKGVSRLMQLYKEANNAKSRRTIQVCDKLPPGGMKRKMGASGSVGSSSASVSSLMKRPKSTFSAGSRSSAPLGSAFGARR